MPLMIEHPRVHRDRSILRRCLTGSCEPNAVFDFLERSLTGVLGMIRLDRGVADLSANGDNGECRHYEYWRKDLEPDV
jgi:hypothetical protein